MIHNSLGFSDWCSSSWWWSTTKTCRIGLILYVCVCVCVCIGCACCWFYRRSYITLHSINNVKTICLAVLLPTNVAHYQLPPIISEPCIKWQWYHSHLTSLRVCCLVITDCRISQILNKIYWHINGITFSPTAMILEELVKKYKRTTHWHKHRWYVDFKTLISLLKRAKKVKIGSSI